MNRNIFSILDILDNEFSDAYFWGPNFPVFGGRKNQNLHILPKLSEKEELVNSPNMDIEESEKKYVLKFDIPGVKKEDLKVMINGNTLEIKASVKKESTKEENKHYTERYYGNYYRSLEIPDNIDRNSMKVSYTDGVLEIIVEKKELPKPEIKELPIA